MKNFLLPVLAAMLMIPTACSKSGHAEPPEPLPRGLSYFYVQNNLDIDLKFSGPHYQEPGTNIVLEGYFRPGTPDLPKRFQVNLYRKILLPAHTKTLVKVFESPDNTEPFNCFYYSDIITFHGICQVYPKGDWDWRHKNIWSYEHWYYTRTGQWTAEYVMTVDHDIWNDW